MVNIIAGLHLPSEPALGFLMETISDETGAGFPI
jgi:hypothetical protein